MTNPKLRLLNSLRVSLGHKIWRTKACWQAPIVLLLRVMNPVESVQEEVNSL